MGATEESATQNAVTRALEGVAQRFNAAEFDSLKITHYPGFYVANVTMQSRNIQRNTSLDAGDENPSQAILSKISE